MASLFIFYGARRMRIGWYILSLLLGCSVISAASENIAADKSRGISPPSPDNVLRTQSDNRFFIENRGQWPSEALFVARVRSMHVWLTESGFVFDNFKFIERDGTRSHSLSIKDSQKYKLGHVLRYELLGAEQNAHTAGDQPMTARYNYFRGADPSRWVRNVGLYREVWRRDVLPGIDMRLYFDKGLPRYDFHVAPGADPSQLVWRISGADEAIIDEKGALRLGSSLGDVVNSGLRAFQSGPDGERDVSCRFKLTADEGTKVLLSFEIGAYDPALPLIIDPLIFSTYLGDGSKDVGYGVEVYGSGSNRKVFATGYTESTSFPETTGGYQVSHAGDIDVFVSRFNSDASDLEQSTFIGDVDDEFARDIDIDADGDVYITGYTDSHDFPTTTGAFDEVYNGGLHDVFVAKLNNDLDNLEWSSFLGGSAGDWAYAIFVEDKHAYITGTTFSGDFHLTPGVFDNSRTTPESEAFITKFSTDGSALDYSTFLGGKARDVALDIFVNSSGEAYVTGYTGIANSNNFQTTVDSYDRSFNIDVSTTDVDLNIDAFVTHINSSASSILYSTYYGGELQDYGAGIFVVDDTLVVITGSTRSDETDDAFPLTTTPHDATHNNQQDAFVARFDLTETGSDALIYSSYLGGKFRDFGYRVVVLGDSAYVAGVTTSTDFPTKEGSYFETNRGSDDLFLAKIVMAGNGAADLEYSTYYGAAGSEQSPEGSPNETHFPNIGMSHDIANNRVYVAGATSSAKFPTSLDAYERVYQTDTDAYVLHFELAKDSIDVIHPTSGTIICTGDVLEIKWSRSGNTDVIIELLDENDDFLETIATKSIVTQIETYDWTIPTAKVGDFRIRIVDAVNPTLDDTSDVFKIYESPSLTGSPIDEAACIGDDAIFSADADGTPDPLVQWQRSIDDGNTWTDIPGADDKSYTEANVTIAMDQYQYRAVFSNDCGSTTSTIAVLTVNEAPLVFASPATLVVCEGANIQFDADASGKPTPSVKWQQNSGSGWQDMPGETNKSLIVNNVNRNWHNRRFRAVFNNVCGTDISEETTLTVNFAPEITDDADNIAACEDDVIVFDVDYDARPEALRQWEVSTDGGSNWDPIPLATGTSFTTTASQHNLNWLYRLRLSNDCTPPLVYSAEGGFTIKPPPSITTQPPEKVERCVGQSFSMLTTPVVVSNARLDGLQWYKDGGTAVSVANGGTTTSLIFFALSASDAGDYYLVAEGDCAPPDTSDTLTLIVNTPPVVTLDPQKQTVCSGATVQFTAAASGQPDPAIQWQVDAQDGIGFQNISDATLATLTIVDVSENEDGFEYRARFKNACGTVFSAAAKLRVISAPRITLEPVTQAVCAADPLQFSVQFQGTAPIAIQWQVDEGGGFADIPGADADSYSIPAASAAMDGNQYQVILSNTCGSITSSTALLTVNTEPEGAILPTRPTVCAGEDVILQVQSQGKPAPSIQWQRDSGGGFGDIPDETGATLKLLNLPYTGITTNYRAIFSNICGVSTSTVVSLTVQQQPQITLQPPAAVTACELQDVDIIVQASGTPTLFVQWQVDEGGGWQDLTGATSLTLQLPGVTFDLDGNRYRAIITNVCSSATSSVVELTVNAAPSVVDAPLDVTTCTGQAATFAVVAAGAPTPTLQWQVNDGGGWQDVNNATHSSLTIANVQVGMDGNEYRLVLTNDCGSVTSSSALLTVHTAPVISRQPPLTKTICPDADLSLSAEADGIPQPGIQWRVDDGFGFVDIPLATSTTLTLSSVSPALSGYRYQAVFDNDCGTAATVPVTLGFYELPLVTLEPEDQEVCENDDAYFTATASGIPAPEVQWQVDRNDGGGFQDLGGATSTNLTLSSVQIPDDGILLRAVFKNTCGSVTSPSVSLTVQVGPSIVSISSSTSICEFTTVTFSAVVAASPAAALQWQEDSGAGFSDIGGATSSSLTLNNVDRSSHGFAYRLTATNTCGTVTSAGIGLSVDTAPMLSVQPTSQTICSLQNVDFFAQSTGSTPIAVRWQVFEGLTWTDIAGADSPTLSLSGVATSSNKNMYRAIFSNDCGADTSAPAGLTVYTGPELLDGPRPRTVCETGSTSFSVSLATLSGIEIQWQQSTGGPFTDLPNETFASLTLSNIDRSEHLSILRAVISNTCATLTTEALLTVNTRPMIVDQPTSTAVCETELAAFDSRVDARPTPTIQWQRNDGGGWQDMAGADAERLELPDVPAASNGFLYRVIYSNECGADTSQAATLTVYTLPLVSKDIPSTLAICTSGSLNLSAEAEGFPTPEVQWERDSGGGFNDMTGSTATTLTISNVSLAMHNHKFRARFSNSCGTVYSSIVCVTINTLPSIRSEARPTTVCEGSDASFTLIAEGRPAPRIQWQSNQGAGWLDLGGETSSTLTLSNVQRSWEGFLYRALASNTCGTVIGDSVALSIDTVPAMRHQPMPKEVCEGGQASFKAHATGKPMPEVQWQVDRDDGLGFVDIGGGGSTTLTISAITELFDGNVYRAVFTNSCGSITSSGALLTVFREPKILEEPQEKEVCEGGNASFVVEFEGMPLPEIQWQVDDGGGFGDMPNETHSTLRLTNVDVTLDGNMYRAILSNSCGSVESEAALLTIATAPRISLQPTTTAICEGLDASFEADATAEPAATVQWQHFVGGSFQDIGGADQPTLQISNVDIGLHLRRYRAVFTNTCGSITSAEAQLIVHTAPTVRLDPEDQSVCIGSSASFSAAANGDPAPAMQWQVDSGGGFGDIAGATQGTLTIADVQDAMDGYRYRAVFSNTCGSVETLSAMLTVLSAPRIAIEPQSSSACVGDDVILTASADGSTPMAIQWQLNEGSGFGDISDATESSLTIPAVTLAFDGNEYRVLFRNDCGVSTSTIALLTVNTLPTISRHPEDAEACVGDEAVFRSNAEGTLAADVQWQRDALDGNGFTDLGGERSTTLVVQALSDVMDGYRYRAVFSNLCGSIESSSATLSVNLAPAISREPEGVTACEGDEVRFSAEASGKPEPEVQWQVDANDGGGFVEIGGATSATLVLNSISAADRDNWYRAIFTNTCGQVTSAAVQLRIDDPPVISDQPDDLTICAGDELFFELAADSPPAFDIQWQLFDGSSFNAIDGATSSTLRLTDVPADWDGRVYRAVLRNHCGTTASSLATLTVETAPETDSHPTDTRACVGDLVTFNATALGRPQPAMQWQVNRNDGSGFVDIPAATEGSLQVPAVTRAMDGYRYRLVFSNPCGMDLSDEAVLSVDEAPQITLQPDDLRACEGEDLLLQAAASGEPAPAVQWQVDRNDGSGFIDLSDATTASFTLRDIQAGQDGYHYRAIFSNRCGNATTLSVSLTVDTFPIVISQPTSQTTCANGDVSFTVDVDGTPLPDIRWQRNTGSGFQDISGAVGPVLSIGSIPADFDGFEYRAVIVNRCGALTSTAALLQVHTAPSVDLEPRTLIVCEGASVTFATAGVGNPTPAIQWQQDLGSGFDDLIGQNGTTLTLTSVSAALNGTRYRAVFSNQCGSANSRSALLEVQEGPAVIRNPEPTVACEGDDITLRADALGSPRPTVQWQIDRGSGFTDIVDATSTTLTLSSIPRSANGHNYRAVFSNSCGSVSSLAAQLQINFAPQIRNEPADMIVCEGDDARFSALAQGLPTPTVQWQQNDGSGWADITGAQSTTLTLTEVGTAMDKLELRAVFSNSCGSATSALVRLNVNTGPVIVRQPEDKDACENEDLVLTAAATGTPTPTVQWQVDDGSGFSAIDEATTTSLTLRAIPASFDGYRYRAVFRNTCGTVASVAAQLRIAFPPMIVTNPTAAVVCQGNTVSFSAAADGEPAPAVQWQVNDGSGYRPIGGATSTTLELLDVEPQWSGNEYKAVFTNICGAVETAPARLTVDRLPVTASEPQDLTVCAGEDAEFQAAAEATPPPQIQWQVDRGAGFNDVPSATGTTLRIENVGAAFNGYRYRALFANRCGVASSSEATLTVLRAPVVTSDPQDVTVCENNDVSFSAAAAGTPAPDLQWQVNDGSGWRDVAGADQLTLELQGVTAAMNGYRYRALFSNRCAAGIASSSAVLTVQRFAMSLLEEGRTIGDTLDFGELIRCENGTTLTKSLVLTSTSIGISTGTIAGVTLSGPFVSNLAEGSPLQAGSPLPFELSFEPDSDGEVFGRLDITIEPCDVSRSIVLRGLQSFPGLVARESQTTFGTVGVGGSAERSIVFVNTGTTLLELDDLADIQAPFQVIRTEPPLPLPLAIGPGDSVIVYVEYRPRVQDRSDESTLTARSATPCPLEASVTLRGNSAPPPRARIVARPAMLDFGDVMVTKDKSLDLILENLGNKVGQISGIAFDDPATRFSLVNSVTIPLIIEPGQQKIIPINFAPQDVRLHSDSLRFANDDGGELVVYLTGNGIPLPESFTSIVVPALTADPNTSDFPIPVILEDERNLRDVQIQRLTLALRFDASVFFPERVSRGRISYNEAFINTANNKLERLLEITIEAADFDVLPTTGSTLTQVFGTVLLGEHDRSDILIDSAAWDVGLGFDSVFTSDGSLELTGICRVGGSRLLRLNRSFGIRSLAPNPVRDEVEIITEGVGSGEASLEIFSSAGKLRYSKIWMLRPSELHAADNFDVHRIATGELPSGSYQIVFRTFERRAVRRLLIIK